MTETKLIDCARTCVFSYIVHHQLWQLAHHQYNTPGIGPRPHVHCCTGLIRLSRSWMWLEIESSEYIAEEVGHSWSLLNIYLMSYRRAGLIKPQTTCGLNIIIASAYTFMWSENVLTRKYLYLYSCIRLHNTGCALCCRSHVACTNVCVFTHAWYYKQ